MAAPSGYLGWIPSGNASYITEPPAGQKTTGWLANEAPPYQYMNWLFYITDQWIQFLAPAMAVGAPAITAVPSVLTTTGALTINTSTLTVASATGVLPGMSITGTYILPGTYVQAVSGTTITMSTKATSSVVSETIIFAQAVAVGATIQTQIQQLDSKVNMMMPIGSVIPTFPKLAGAYVCTATTAADSAGMVLMNGQTISDVTSPMNGVTVPNINDSCFIMGLAAGGDSTVYSANTKALAHTHTLSDAGGACIHTWNSIGYAYLETKLNGNAGTGPNFEYNFIQTHSGFSSASTTGTTPSAGLVGATDGITGTPLLDIRPKYISAVYLMKIK